MYVWVSLFVCLLCSRWSVSFPPQCVDTPRTHAPTHPSIPPSLLGDVCRVLSWHKQTNKQVVERCTELMLILKWGGDLTKLGERQAERLGERFTQAMYPDPR